MENNTGITRKQESSKGQIKLPVLFYKVYLLTPEERNNN